MTKPTADLLMTGKKEDHWHLDCGCLGGTETAENETMEKGGLLYFFTYVIFP